MVKRSVDILFALFLLIAALPILLLAAILIKLDSEGPVLFRQTRVGQGFRRFQLVKLRSMAYGADGSAYTLGADPRVTRIGYWLRRLKVDELPQLWHVLTGEMSLVGPRPVVPELCKQYRHAYRRLLTVRPGLTDPAAIKYCQESDVLALAADPRRYFHSVVMPDKLRISQFYMNTASVRSDLGVLAQTIFALLHSWRTADTPARPDKARHDSRLTRRQPPRRRAIAQAAAGLGDWGMPAPWARATHSAAQGLQCGGAGARLHDKGFFFG